MRLRLMNTKQQLKRYRTNVTFLRSKVGIDLEGKQKEKGTSKDNALGKIIHLN